MKTLLLFVPGLFALAASASAQSGHLNFNGEVVHYTCVVSADGNAGSGDASVQLPTVAARSLSAAGARAGMRRFNIVVGSASNPCAASSVRSRWIGTAADVDPASGRLSNRPGAGMAVGVQVALLNADQQDIDLRDNANSQEVAFDAGVATLEYHGQYYGTGALGEGAVNTSAQYELEYR